MQDFVMRIVQEKSELDDRQTKLISFMHSKPYAELPAVEQGLLMVQLEAMGMYSQTLARRLEIYRDR